MLNIVDPRMIYNQQSRTRLEWIIFISLCAIIILVVIWIGGIVLANIERAKMDYIVYDDLMPFNSWLFLFGIVFVCIVITNLIQYYKGVV